MYKMISKLFHSVYYKYIYINRMTKISTMTLVLLVSLPFLISCLDYNDNHTVSCQNINNTNYYDNLQYLWPKLILHEIDRYSILIWSPLVFILQLIVMITYLKFTVLMHRPGNIFFGLLIIEMILNMRLLISAIYVSINSQFNPMPNNFQYFCDIMSIISTFFVFLHVLYLILFLLYVIFLFRFSLRKKSQTFWKVLHIGMIFLSICMTFFLRIEDFMGLNYDGLCGLSLTRKPKWNIVLPSLILALALCFSILGAFTFFYFHKHMPKTEGFQKRKFNESKIIGMYVIGFSIYITVIGVFSLVININCESKHPNSGLTIFATVSNFLKLLEYCFLLFLIIKNHYFRYKLKKMLRGIFQKQNLKSDSDLQKYQGHFLEMQELAFNEQLLQIKEESREIDLLLVSQIYTVITGIYITFIEYFKGSKIEEARPIYYLQKTTFSLQNSSAMNYDTQVRLLSKLKILKCDLIIHSPRIFQNLLLMDGLQNVQSSFSIFQNSQKMYNLVQGKGGKSGQFFFFSADNKFVLKTITLEEFQFLIQNLQAFYDYYIKHPHSLLAKIYGLFTIKGDEMQRTFRFILMKNILGCTREQVQRTYDMKGSKYDRQVLKKGREYDNIQKYTLKDTDFMNLEGKIKINNEISHQLRQTIRQDTLFLKSLNLIDYSLLVVKVQWLQELQNPYFWDKLQRIPSEEEKGIYYHIGIIDYMQKWDLQKKSQKWWKNLIGKKEVSAEEPNKYQNRFMIFVDEITTYLALNNKEIEEFELASMSKERHPQKDTKDSDEMQLNLNKNP